MAAKKDKRRTSKDFVFSKVQGAVVPEKSVKKTSETESIIIKVIMNKIILK
jgi:hypothetical protein